jgi:hypothetical protein
VGSTLDARAAAGEGQAAIAEVTPNLAREAAAHTARLHATLRESLHRASVGVVGEWRRAGGARPGLSPEGLAAFQVLDAASVRDVGGGGGGCA